MSESESLLAIENLGYRYGEREAVKAVAFEVKRGECFGLLGANGAGKTTTISCIAGLLSEWTGSMQFCGHAFRPAQVTADRAKLGFVPQELAIYPNLTAEENLRFFAKLCGVARADLAAAIKRNLELSGLTARRQDLVRTFSGGMQRRLNLAVGLLHSPALVLLDEPTVGVDPQSRNHLFETLLRLKSEGLSLLYTTHYMEEAERLCDRIGIINEGAIVAIGTPRELAAGIDQPDANLEEVFLHLTGKRLRDE
ncbi:MAG: ABC transporter ATP-binding protein [Pirellulaceae bacterium]